ncbi:MAG TPA: nucleotidyltransferase domain-containing protein [Roseiflexaceae bacterium]|nr:nucleotidyltransferase domain-containing protein [Roseiflexaceae bacterium]
MSIQLRPYDPFADPVIQALVAEAQADPDVIGLVLTGSRALGEATDESDYDVIFVVTDEALARYEQAGEHPRRGTTVTPPIDTADIWNDAPRDLRLGKQVDWMLPAYAESLVLYDRNGETAPVIDAMRWMPEEQAQAEAAAWYDGYLNGLYRSLKCWRRGNELGGRLEAAGALPCLLRTLFALERRWCPYPSRLHRHLHHLEGQGWQPGELRAFLLDITATGDPRQQQQLARRVGSLLRARGFGHVYDGWNGQIDTALAWSFD